MPEITPHEPLEFTPPSAEAMATLLPSYSFDCLLAVGGMGAVYKATHTSLDRKVAIKVLPPELGLDESFRTSFEKEAKLTARLNHPNLIGIYDFGSVGDMLYIVMEFVDGESLYQKTLNATLEPTEALEVTRDIALGLANAHAAGILHRDIKPANILITQDGTPKIGDFGLARSSEQVESGVIYGTPGYAAPEVVDNPSLVGPQTDVFAVGVLLYDLITGQLPDAQYKPVTQLATGCNPAIDILIRKATAANPAARHADAQKLADDLTQLLEKAKKSKVTVAPIFNAPASSANSTAPQSHRAPARPTTSVKKNKNSSLVYVLIILALLGGLYATWEWKTQKEATIAAQKEASATPKKSKSSSSAPSISKALQAKHTQLLQRTLSGRAALTSSPTKGVALSDGSRFVAYIDKELTWLQANRWCNERGGYLATVGSVNDFDDITQLVPLATQAWIGAATAGNKRWAWTDGTPWGNYPKLRSSSEISYAQISNDESIVGKDGKHTSGFFIEWRTDDSTPGSLQDRLSRVEPSTQTLPSGSISFGDRHYLICAEPTDYATISKIAQEAGATLAAPSDSEELKFLQELIHQNIPSDELCRLQSALHKEAWSWRGTEKWTQLDWRLKQPIFRDSLVASAQPGAPWSTVTASTKVPYAVLEWSSDSSSDKADFIKQQEQLYAQYAEARTQILDLKNQAAKKLKSLEKERDSLLVKNSIKLISEIRIYKKSISKSQLAKESNYLDELLGELRQTRRVDASPEALEEAPSRKIARLLTSQLKGEQKIDTYHTRKVQEACDTYKQEMQGLIDSFEQLQNIAETAKTDLQQTCKSPEAFLEAIL